MRFAPKTKLVALVEEDQQRTLKFSGAGQLNQTSPLSPAAPLSFSWSGQTQPRKSSIAALETHAQLSQHLDSNRFDATGLNLATDSRQTQSMRPIRFENRLLISAAIEPGPFRPSATSQDHISGAVLESRGRKAGWRELRGSFAAYENTFASGKVGSVILE